MNLYENMNLCQALQKKSFFLTYNGGVVGAQNSVNLESFRGSLRCLVNCPVKSGRRFEQIQSILAESKLEADYIQRFLGQLTPLEESRLCELKYGLHSTHKGKIPNDAHLLRYIVTACNSQY